MATIKEIIARYMDESRNYKRLAEAWENNATFYLQEIERITTMYNNLLKQLDTANKRIKELETKINDNRS